MTKMRDLNYNDRLPEMVMDSLMEFISTMHSNFQVTFASTTSLQIVAGADNAQVAVGINGKWRYNAATVNAAHPGGAAGSYDIYVTAADNNFFPSGAPPGSSPETDATVYTFGLAIRATGSPPATALYRKIGTCTWDGTQITDFTITVGWSRHHSTHEPGGTDPITPYLFSQVTTLQGTLAGRPTAATANTGFTYLATDVNGGTTYRSNGTTWTQQAMGVTAAPQAHAASHLAGGTDALAWTTINGYGTLAARPSAAATNTGYDYYATDTTTLYRSNGASWDSLSAAPPSNTAIAQAILLAGTLASRPAAAAGNTGFYYIATDAAILYQSTGATWSVMLGGSGGGADVPTALYRGQVSNVVGTVYTVPAGKQTAYKTVRLANTDTTLAHTVTIYDGGTAAANTILVIEIAAGDSEEISLVGAGGQAGGTIAAVCDTNAVVTMTLEGSEEVPGNKVYKKAFQNALSAALASVVSFTTRARVSHMRAVNLNTTTTRGFGFAKNGGAAVNVLQPIAGAKSQIPAQSVLEYDDAYYAFGNGDALWAGASAITDVVLTVYTVEG